MEPIIIALIGAGSRSFGPETVRDVLLSEALAQCRINLRLMDIAADKLSDIGGYAKSLAEKLGRKFEISTTTSQEAALDGAQFAVTAVEIERSFYWAQDYHIPRKIWFPSGFRRERRARVALPCPARHERNGPHRPHNGARLPGRHPAQLH